ncbi:MAG: hypothetical protein QXH47_05045 [Candidatus Bathyarchaeia archaeon]
MQLYSICLFFQNYLELEKVDINIPGDVRKYLEELKEWDEILSQVKLSEKGLSIRSMREDRETH